MKGNCKDLPPEQLERETRRFQIEVNFLLYATFTFIGFVVGETVGELLPRPFSTLVPVAVALVINYYLRKQRKKARELDEANEIMKKKMEAVIKIQQQAKYN